MGNKTLDPNYISKVKNSFYHQGFMRLIKAEIRAIEPGFCEIRVGFDQDLCQQNGFFHAGIMGTIADNAGGYAAYTLMEAESSVLTVEYKINFLSPAKGERLIGRGKVIRHGQLLTVCSSDVFVLNGKLEKKCATAQITVINLR